MYKVKLVGPGLFLNGAWHWINDIVEITEDTYEKNKDFLEIIEKTSNKSKTEADEDASKNEINEEAETSQNEELTEADEDASKENKKNGKKNKNK